MTFLNLWAAGFAALAPVIVLLYLLKLKRRPLSVSTLMFWQRVLQESRRRAFFQKLRQLLSLLLHLLIFALILGALMRPVLDRFVREGGSTVLILDTRARMQATEADGSPRFAREKADAAGLIRQTGGARQMALISANATPVVVTPFTDDERALRLGLESLAPTDAGGNLDSAIQLAGDLLASRKGERRVVVLTDHAPKDTAQIRPLPVTYVSCARAADNVAITRFATRPLLNSPETSEVLLEIANFSRKPAKGNVEISFDGKLLDVKPYALRAGERRLEIFPAVPRPSSRAQGWLSARLDTPDPLAVDNVAYAVLSAQPPSRVLLVTKGNWFLEKMLAADQGIAFELVEPDAFQPALASKFDAVIMDQFLPAGFDLASSRGNLLFIKATPFGDGKAPLEQPLVSDTDAQHPVMRLVNLQNITMLRAASLALPKIEGWNWQAPIRSFEHPLMITGERLGTGPARRVAALAMDITDSDLPLRVAFPLMMSNIINWLAGEQAADIPGALAGATIPLAANESISVHPELPGAPSSKSPPQMVRAGFFQPLQNGFYRIDRPDGAHWLAVNTFDPAESDLRALDAPLDESPRLSLLPLANFASWPIWQYLAIAAFVLFAGEWWLFHRRRTE
jgi:Aerotolerance regulator N-terminal/von Willebrand factor type A domain